MNNLRQNLLESSAVVKQTLRKLFDTKLQLISVLETSVRRLIWSYCTAISARIDQAMVRAAEPRKSASRIRAKDLSIESCVLEHFGGLCSDYPRDIQSTFKPKSIKF